MMLLPANKSPARRLHTSIKPPPSQPQVLSPAIKPGMDLSANKPSAFTTTLGRTSLFLLKKKKKSPPSPSWQEATKGSSYRRGLSGILAVVDEMDADVEFFQEGQTWKKHS